MSKAIKLHVKQQANAAALNCAVGDSPTLDFETEYLPGVVAAEMGYGPLEAQKAQAVAARSVAYAGAILAGGAISDIGGDGQAFDAVKRDNAAYAQCHRAVQDTAGIVVTYGGKPVRTHYADSNGGVQLSAKEAWPSGAGLPYEVHQIDPWDAAAGYPKNGHGVGLSQRGAMYAASIGKTYREILAFYYPGTELRGEYGESALEAAQETEAEIMPGKEGETMSGLKILVCYQTRNRCYQKGTPAHHVNVLVHGCAAVNKELRRYVDCEPYLGKNLYDNHWNREYVTKTVNGVKQQVAWSTCVHGFVGEDKDGGVIFAQMLPLGQACWGCDKGSKGSYNYDPQAHIQFETCRGSGSDSEYFWKAIEVSALFCAYMCQQRGFDPQGIVSHKEAHAQGYANNHGDPEDYYKLFGYDMDQFRDKVAALAAGEAIEPEFIYVTQVVQRGDKGELVEEMQTLLLALGYGLPKYGADGKFGDETAAALKAFQGDHGLLQDGICGQATWDILSDAGQDDQDDVQPVEAVLWMATIRDLTEAQRGVLQGVYPGAEFQQQV